jgi:ribosome-associated heat shock protein Hsp15
MADSSVRLDRWLWAARFFKTRALASAAIAGGKVHVNGTRAKPAKQLRVGDALRVRIGPYDWLVTVRELSEHRGPAQRAQQLYEESADGRQARERLAHQLKIAPAPAYQGKGRPTKKERREMQRLEDGEV